MTGRPLCPPTALKSAEARPSTPSSAALKSSMGFAGLTRALTSNPPENCLVSSVAAANAVLMKANTMSVNTTSENIASVIPVRNLDAIGYAIAVRMTGDSVRPRPRMPLIQPTR